jgi:hypothetical protein
MHYSKQKAHWGLCSRPCWRQIPHTMARKNTKKAPLDNKLKGWKAIGTYLGISPSAAQRWADNGMPVKREGRFMVAQPEELRGWVGRESHMPEAAHIVTPETDISAALKASITATKRQKK